MKPGGTERMGRANGSRIMLGRRPRGNGQGPSGTDCHRDPAAACAGRAPDRMFRLSRALLSSSARASDPEQGPVWPPLLFHGNRRVALSQSADRQYRRRIDVVGIHHVGDALHRREDHVLLPGFKMIEFGHELLLQQLGRIP